MSSPTRTILPQSGRPSTVITTNAFRNNTQPSESTSNPGELQIDRNIDSEIQNTIENREATPERIVLRLKVEKKKKKVTWGSNAIDNEFKDTKSSKCCCIFHKQREFGESDTESDTNSDTDSSDSTDSDSDDDISRKRHIHQANCPHHRHGNEAHR